MNVVTISLSLAPDIEVDDTPLVRASLDRFLRSVERRAFVIARYALRDDESALDVVQDVMLKLCEKYAGRDPAEWPKLFFTMLNNRITDIRRQRRVRDGIVRLVSWLPGGEPDEPDPVAPDARDRDSSDTERSVWQNELRGRINDAVGKLPERQRQALLLREWQGFSVRETAEILGCSEGAVKQHVFRANQSLRGELVDLHEHE